MVSSLFFVVLLLWTLRCGGPLSVQDESLIQVAFHNEPVNATCKTTVACKPEYTNFEINYYRIDPKGNEILVQNEPITQPVPPGCNANESRAKNYPLHIEPTRHTSVTGTYYCEVRWKTSTVRGEGTFILFRDKGYTEPLSTLQITLTIAIVILAVLAIMGTALLFWKRKIIWPWKSHVKKNPNQRSAGQQKSSNLVLSESMYADLEPRQSDIYLTIEKNAKTQAHEKMPKPKALQQKTQRETQDIYENNTADVYENI